MCLSHLLCQKCRARHPQHVDTLPLSLPLFSQARTIIKIIRDDKTYCTAITKIVKRHEAMDCHKIVNHSKVLNNQTSLKEPPQKVWATTIILNRHQSYKQSQKLWTNTRAVLLWFITLWWVVVANVHNFCEVHTFVLVNNFLMSHNFCDDSKFCG